MTTILERLESTAEDMAIIQNEIAIFVNLIKERKHPLDLVRELLSNAGAREVDATRIEVSYTKDREGHVFEICDNGCGMDYTGVRKLPGRLDKFIGLGLSAIAGIKSDEFSWKGLGSKLAYQSRRVEITTRQAGQPLYVVRVNDPWGSLERGVLPNPRITKYPDADEPPGTSIKVVGHPPHRLEEPFTMDEIRTFLLHRTFAGFTRPRDNPPTIVLSVLGETATLEFGFPEFKGIPWPKGFAVDHAQRTLFVDITATSNLLGPVRMKGFLTWDAGRHGLHKDGLNTGLILSSKGIPYFSLDMEEYGSRSIIQARPGESNTCLVVECDGIYSEMNISRSGLVDSARSLELTKVVRQLFERLERSQEYLEFRAIPQSGKRDQAAEYLAKEKRGIESEDQNWVIYEREGQPPLVLMREPQSEIEVNALIWKLEALDALPFARFQTLAYVGAAKGPDLLVNFQEESGSEPLRAAVVEVERNFYNYRSHGHYPAQYPKVICWDAPPSGRKVRLDKTKKKYKFTVTTSEYQVHVYVLRLMDRINVATRKELREMGIEI